MLKPRIRLTIFIFDSILMIVLLASATIANLDQPDFNYNSFNILSILGLLFCVVLLLILILYDEPQKGSLNSNKVID